MAVGPDRAELAPGQARQPELQLHRPCRRPGSPRRGRDPAAEDERRARRSARRGAEARRRTRLRTAEPQRPAAVARVRSRVAGADRRRPSRLGPGARRTLKAPSAPVSHRRYAFRGYGAGGRSARPPAPASPRQRRARRPVDRGGRRTRTPRAVAARVRCAAVPRSRRAACVATLSGLCRTHRRRRSARLGWRPDVAGRVVAGRAELVLAGRVGVGVPAGAQRRRRTSSVGSAAKRSPEPARRTPIEPRRGSGPGERVRRPAPRSAPGRAGPGRWRRRRRGGSRSIRTAAVAGGWFGCRWRAAVVDVAGRVAGVVGDRVDARRDHGRARPCPPAAIVGAPPSIRIAVKGAPPPSRTIPEAASVARRGQRHGRFVQPPGSPASRVTGSVLSTRRAVVAGVADRMPEPETATACR